MNQDNSWKRGIHITPYGVYIECGTNDDNFIEQEASGIVSHMSYGGEKLECERGGDTNAPLASAHAIPVPKKEDVIEDLLKKIFGAVDETPIAQMQVPEEEEVVESMDDCVYRKHMVSIGFSDNEEDGVNIQCSSGSGDNMKASALLRAALLFMPDYNDKKWDEFISLMYEMSHLLWTTPDENVEAHQ